MSEPTSLDALADALRDAEGKTPSDVVAAFLPDCKTIFGQKLLPLTAGHDLFLEKIAHPFATGGKEWTSHDLAVAMFAFTTPSRDLFRMVANDTLEDALFDFLDSLPFGDLEPAAAELVGHWISHRATALAMRSPRSEGQKKTAASVGG